MIFGTMKRLEEYNFLPDELIECFEYVKAHEMEGWENGRHDIDGERLYVNLAEYETTTRDNRFWEAHRQYLDVHVILNGEERIDLNFIDNMEQKNYEPDKDFLPLSGSENSHVVLGKYDFLVCYPGDGHMTGLMAEPGKSSKLKKAIFKVQIQA